MIFGRGHYQKKQAKASPGRLFDVRFRLTFSIYSNLICKERCKVHSLFYSHIMVKRAS